VTDNGASAVAAAEIGNIPEGPCFTEAELRRLGILPPPAWMREPPQPKRGPTLFD
jgi:hypothetical protein